MQRSNMLTVEIPNVDLTLSYFNYDKDLLYNLREDHEETHAFFRHRVDNEDIILVFPILNKPDIKIKGASEITVNPSKNIFLAKKFIHELIFRKVLGSGAAVEKYTDIKFLSRKTTDNKLSQILSTDIQIGFKKGYEITSRIFFVNDNPQIFLPIDVFYRWDINVNCKDLIDKGINLLGVYVCENQPSKFKLLAQRRTLLGKIKQINNDGTCVIENEDITIVKNTNMLYIENNYQNRNSIIKKYLGSSKYEECIRVINDGTAERNSAKSKVDAINTISDWLCKNKVSNECGLEFKMTGFFDDTNPHWDSKLLNPPTFIFDLHAAKTAKNSDLGLKNFGPYDADIFDKKSPNIAVLCLKQDRGTVTEFIKKMTQGLPKVSYGNLLPYGNGFKDKYHLNAINIQVFEIENSTLEEYSNTISKCLNSGTSFDLAIVQSSVQHKEFQYKDSPYLLTKSKFMSSDVPVQEINIETMKKPDNNLAWILNNIALASYSKMGGNPWVIPSNKSIDRELVIGLGSAVFKNGRFKSDKRIVGITTVFNSDGTYLLSNKSKEVKFENYFDELTENLKRIFDDVSKSEGWIKGDNVRLVFHCFKPFKYKEIYAIKSLVEKLCKDYVVLFAFVHVANFQKLFWIDDSNNGEKSAYDATKGEWMPYKGSILKLDKYNCLIQLTGSKDIKMASHGMAKPICLSLHRASTYIDLDYLSQQLFYFAFMSYRSFSSSPLPVTIWYSQLIAKLLGSMSYLPKWDSDVMNNKLKHSRWFL